MDFFAFIHTPMIIFLAVVAPMWIIAHYVTRWRVSKSISADDEQVLSDLWESSARMETRIATLEQILDAEAPGWRTKL
jgi:phage shock protein B